MQGSESFSGFLHFEGNKFIYSTPTAVNGGKTPRLTEKKQEPAFREATTHPPLPERRFTELLHLHGH